MKEREYDYSISLIRLVATFLIITCHIMQYLALELAWWFNVGVQIFLCMSGFLYGKKDKISDELVFFKNNIIKILVDYYVVIIPIILLFMLFVPEQLSIITTIKVLLTYGTLNGGGHLWYIPYCLFCYLITPFLSHYFENNKHIIKCFLVLSMLTIVITETFFNYFNSAWIFCYILGFFLGNISDCKKIKLFRNMTLLIIAGAILLNFIQLLQDYVLELELNGIVASLYGSFCNFAYVFLGVALFIIFKAIFSIILKRGCPNFIKKLCLYTDRYSYDIYLVHQFVILGPFSLMRLTNNMVINIVLILAITVVSSVIVNFISIQIKHRIRSEGV